MKDEITILINAAVEGQTVMDTAPPNNPDYAGIWSGKPAIVTLRGKIDVSVTKIEGFEDDVQDDSGNETAKNKARELAAKLAYKMSKPMSVYAASIGDDALQETIDFSWSDLRYGKDADLIDNWSEVHDQAAGVGAILVTDGYIGATDVADLQDLIDDFVAKKGVPKAKKDTKKGIHLNVDDEAKVLRGNIKLMRQLLVQFKDSPVALEREFYAAADAAFDEDNTNVRHRAMVVKYLDEATGIVLPKVKGQLRELPTLNKKQSSIKGLIPFTRQETPIGNYTLDSTLDGYESHVEINIGLDHKSLKRLVIKLKKKELVPGHPVVN